jgi:hypothetical protein
MDYSRVAHITQLQMNMGITQFRITCENCHKLTDYLVSKNLTFNVEYKPRGLCIINLTYD